MNSGSKGLRNSSRPHYFTLSDCIWWACQSCWLAIQHTVIKGTAVFSWIQRKMPKPRYDPLKSSARNSVVTDTAMCLNIIFIRRISYNKLWSLWRKNVFEALHEIIVLIGFFIFRREKQVNRSAASSSYLWKAWQYTSSTSPRTSAGI